MIRGTALNLAGATVSPGVANLRALGAEVERAGCDDPWVLFLVHRLGVLDPDFADTMLKAATAISAAGYPPFPVWLARAEAVRGARYEGIRPPGTLLADCLESRWAAPLRRSLLPKAITMGVGARVFQRASAENASSKDDAPAMCRVVDSVPGIAEWFRLTVRGHAEINMAWEARGGGWANSVSTEQWQHFGEHLAVARSVLERACQLEPNAPEPAKELINVELGTTGIEAMRRRFDDTVRTRFDYLPAYDEFLWGLRPRWFGSEQAVLTFGRTCLATQRFDTAVPWQMLRAVQDVAADQDDADAYYAKQAPWKELQTMFDGYLAHGNPARRNYVLSNKLVLAAKRGLDGEVAQLLKELHYKIDPQVKDEWNLSV